MIQSDDRMYQRHFSIPLILLASITSMVNAQVYGDGAHVPAGGGGTMPQYFSGTLNSASGSVYASPAPDPEQEVYLVDAGLSFEYLFLSVQVKSWTWVPGEPKTVFASLSCWFDSTIFPDGTQVTVNMTGHDNLGRTYEDQETRPVKNRALLGNHRFPWVLNSQSHEVVADRLAGRYAIDKCIDGNLTLQNWRSKIGGANFLFVSTHGINDYYEMDSPGMDTFTDEAASDPDTHKTQLEASVGSAFTSSTYPPFNPSSVPPPNFVFIDACDTYKSDFTWVLYPKLNLYDGSGIPRIVNMFTAGWNTKMNASDTRRIADSLAQQLVAGNTAYMAILLAVQELQVAGVESSYGDPIDVAMIVRAGDPFTKVAGVYTGTHDPTLDWHS